MGIIGPQGDLPNGQRPLVQRFRLGKLSLGVVKDRQVSEDGGDIGVIRTQHFLPDRERPLVQRLGLGISTLHRIEHCEAIQA